MKHNKFKKIACALGITSCFCLGVTLTGISPSAVFAQNQTPYIVSTSQITNADFTGTAGASYLESSFSGWTSDTNTAQKGIINVRPEVFSSYCKFDYHLAPEQNPGQVAHSGEDNKVLMINSQKAELSDTSVPTAVIDSYASNSITLSARSFYKLSVYATTTTDATATAMLSDLSQKDLLTPASNKILSIKTTALSAWQEYSFYIATGLDDQNIKLNLALGNIGTTSEIPSTGAAFFDRISLYKCSAEYFANTLANEPASGTNFSTITYNNYQLSSTDLNPSVSGGDFNFGFENGLVNWTQIGQYDNNTPFVAEVRTKSQIDFGMDYSMNNQKALYLSAQKTNPVYVGFESQPFNIHASNIYRISVKAKTNALEGSATIKLLETDYVHQTEGITFEPKSSTITFSTTESNQLCNDYQEFLFYVMGYELHDTQCKLQFALGEQGVPASGTVVFDSVTVSRCSFTEFNGIQDATAIKKLTLSTVSGTPSVANGSFTVCHPDTVIPEYPFVPDSWTPSPENSTEAIFGVVNTSKWNLIAPNKRPQATTPQNSKIELADGSTITVPENASNNILMMYNPTGAKQIVTCPTFTATAGSYYKLSFNHKTYGNALNMQIQNNDGTVLYEQNFASSTAWQTQNVIIKTEYFDTENMKLIFTLDSQNTAYAYFDNFQFFTLSNMTDQTFKTASSANTATLDLSNLGFLQKGKFNPTNNTYEATLFNGNLEEGNQTAGNPIAYGGLVQNEEGTGNMLKLHTTAGNTKFTMTSKNTISLGNGKFYKISAKIKTDYSAAPKANAHVGAYIKLIGIDNAEFTGILSQEFDDFILYVASNTDANVNVQFGINYKSETISANATALFDDFKFETIEKADFQHAVASPNVVIANAQAVDDDPEPEPTPPAQNPANLWIQISTILMILAIVIAIIGALIRKAKSNKTKVIKHKAFEEKVSLVRDASVIEAEKRRNDEIKALNKEKTELENYIKQLEDEHKQRVADERKISGKKITRKAEKEFKAYAHSRQRVVNDIARIDNRIKDAQSQDYLARIIKVVQAEKVDALEKADNANATQNTANQNNTINSNPDTKE